MAAAHHLARYMVRSSPMGNIRGKYFGRATPVRARPARRNKVLARRCPAQ